MCQTALGLISEGDALGYQAFDPNVVVPSGSRSIAVPILFGACATAVVASAACLLASSFSAHLLGYFLGLFTVGILIGVRFWQRKDALRRSVGRSAATSLVIPIMQVMGLALTVAHAWLGARRGG